MGTFQIISTKALTVVVPMNSTLAMDLTFQNGQTKAGVAPEKN